MAPASLGRMSSSRAYIQPPAEVTLVPSISPAANVILSGVLGAKDQAERSRYDQISGGPSLVPMLPELESRHSALSAKA